MTLPTLDNDDNKEKSRGLPKIDMPPIDEEDKETSEGKMPSIDSLGDIDSLEDVDEENTVEDQGDFEEVDVDQALYNEDDDTLNDEINAEIDKDSIDNELPDMRADEEELLADEDDYYPDYEEDVKKSKEKKFINRKKRRIIPFGGSRSKGKRIVKSSDMDDRKNKLAKTKIIQLLVILGVLLLFFIGLKNTFAPSHVYTSSQIKQFAAEGAGQTGFPSERGKFFVENFMDSYLNLDKSNPELLAALSYYYGRERFSNENYTGLNLDWSNDVRQDVIVSPKVFEVNLLTEYSAQYKLSAYVSNSHGEAFEERNRVGKWLSFSVNVYYDEEDDSLAITPESPVLIPNTNISEPISVPTEKRLGTGEVNNEILQAMIPTIDGFVESYAKSSLDSHNSVLQYIEDRSDISLYDGFNGAVEIDGSPENAIKKVVYNTGREGIYEVDVTVKWLDVQASSEGNKISYTSRYKMTISSDGSGKFAVTSFSPYVYYTNK